VAAGTRTAVAAKEPLASVEQKRRAIDTLARELGNALDLVTLREIWRAATGTRQTRRSADAAIAIFFFFKSSSVGRFVKLVEVS
jgi:hypothetical protein